MVGGCRPYPCPSARQTSRRGRIFCGAESSSPGKHDAVLGGSVRGRRTTITPAPEGFAGGPGKRGGRFPSGANTPGWSRKGHAYFFLIRAVSNLRCAG